MRKEDIKELNRIIHDLEDQDPIIRLMAINEITDFVTINPDYKSEIIPLIKKLTHDIDEDVRKTAMEVFNIMQDKYESISRAPTPLTNTAMVFLDPKAAYAYKLGKKRLPEFKQSFPQGTTYEVYNAGPLKLSKCDVPIPGFHFLALTFKDPISIHFAEFDTELIPDYCLVYYRKGFFNFVPLSDLQKQLLSYYNSDFYRAWLYHPRGYFEPMLAPCNPVNFIFDEVFNEEVVLCRKMFQKILKFTKRNSPSSKESIFKELRKFEKSLSKIQDNFELDYQLYYDHVTNLNDHLISELGPLLAEIRTGPTLEDKALAHLIGRPAIKLTKEPIYIIPNGKTTIVFLITPHQGWKANQYQNLQHFYLFVKKLKDNLQKLIKAYVTEI